MMDVAGWELLVVALAVVAVGALLGAMLAARSHRYVPPSPHIDRRRRPRLPSRSANA